MATLSNQLPLPLHAALTEGAVNTSHADFTDVCGRWPPESWVEERSCSTVSRRINCLTPRLLCCSRDEVQYAKSLHEAAAQQSFFGSIWRSATDSAGRTGTARLLPASGVSFVILVAVVAALWQRRALLRHKCREPRHGREAGGRDHSNQQHSRHNGIVSVPDMRSLLSRKQSA